MAESDGSFIVDVGMDVSDAEKQLTRLKTRLNKLGDELDEKKAKRTYLEKEFEDAYQKLEELKKNAPKNEFGGLANPEDVELFNQLTQKANELYSAWEKTNREIGIDDAVYQATLEKYGKLQKKGIFSAGKIKEAWGKLSGAVVNGVKKVFDFNKAGEAAAPVFSRLGNMIKNAFVFNVISQGLNYVKQKIGDYLQANTGFMNALGQLKGVLATAFQPIYEAIVPALTTFINLITRAVAVVAQFISALFGKTAKQSQASARALNKQAGALGNVSEEAEEAAGSLAGFDEINTIQTENAKAASGGGGGGGGISPGDTTFDYGFEDTAFKSWGEAFSDFLDKILNDGIPKLKEGFGKFASWFNDFNKKLLDMFTFEGVNEKVARIGTDLANAFNYLVDSIDWALFGAAIGAGLGLAITLAVNFLSTFDWVGLGNSIAQFINGAIEQINWQDVGRLLWEGFTLGIRMLVGFLLGLDMTDLAQAASNIVIGFVNALTQFMLETDWTALIEKVLQQVTDFAAGVDYSGIATAVFTAMGVAFGAAISTIIELIFDAWDKVVEWWHDVAFEDGHFTMDGLLDGIKDALKNIGTWIYNNILLPFWNGFCKAFEIGSPSKLMDRAGHFIMDGLLGGLKDAWRAIPQFFSQIWQDVKNWWNSNVSNFTDPSWWADLGRRMMDGLLDGLRSIFNGLSSWASSVWSSITSSFSGSNARAAISNGMPSPIMRSALPNIPIMDVPALARGAVIPPNREFLAVLGDQSSGTNVEAPLNTIKQALLEAMAEGGMGNADIHITVELDGREVAKNTVHHINRMTRAAGKPVILY